MKTSHSKEPFFKCRYIIAFVGFLLFFLQCIYRTAMSVAIVAMVNHTAIRQLSHAESDSCPVMLMNKTETENNDVINKQEGEFIWSPHLQGYILGSFFIGYVIVQIPSGILVERYGCKWFLFSISLFTGVLTFLIPLLSYLSVYAVIVVQTLRGSAQGFIQSSVAILTTNWFPKSERGLLFAFMLSANSLGSFMGSIFTGYICDSAGGWSNSFYAVGSAGLALSLIIFFQVTESPKLHTSISKDELDYILSNQEGNLNQKRPKKPWRSILTSVPVWALALGFFGHMWAVSIIATVQSIFLGVILHYPIIENGIFTAMPFLAQFLANQAGFLISLYIQNKYLVSVNFLRKFWTYFSAIGFSACLLGIYFVGCNRNFSVILSIISIGFIGFGLLGVGVVAVDMTPTFAGSLQAIICTFAFTSSFILPVLVGYLTDEMQTIEQWNKVFFISISVTMLSKTLFVIFGSAEVQPWNFVEECTQLNSENKNYKADSRSTKEKEITRF